MKKYLHQLVKNKSEHKKVWRKKENQDLGLFSYIRKKQEKYTVILKSTWQVENSLENLKENYWNNYGLFFPICCLVTWRGSLSSSRVKKLMCIVRRKMKDLLKNESWAEKLKVKPVRPGPSPLVYCARPPGTPTPAGQVLLPWSSLSSRTHLILNSSLVFFPDISRKAHSGTKLQFRAF